MVDDHPLFADGLRLLLEEALDAELLHVQSVPEALTMLESDSSIDLLLADLFMPGDDGMDLLDAVRLRSLFVPVVVVSSSRSAGDVSRCLARGALGYVPKSSTSDEIVLALQAASKGERYLAKELRAPLEELNARADEVSRALTPRQLDTLRLLAEGLSNKEIAATLGVTSHTVKAHLGVVFQTLGVDNRVQCVSAARELGLVTR